MSTDASHPCMTDLCDPWHPPVLVPAPEATGVQVATLPSELPAVRALVDTPAMLLGCWRTGATLRTPMADAAARAADRLRFGRRVPGPELLRRHAIHHTRDLLRRCRNSGAVVRPVWTAYSETGDQPEWEPVWLVGLQARGIRGVVRACARRSDQQHIAVSDGRHWGALAARRHACGRVLAYEPIAQPPQAIRTPIVASLC